MKLTKTLAAIFTALSFVIVGCEDNKAVVPHDHDGDGKPDHGPGAHADPVPHDHDGDGKPDHGPGEHGKPVPHDHDGDGKPDHGPGEHGGHDQDGDDHDGHEHAKKVAGPNGGKVMTSPDFKNEFLITDDRMVRITFLDKDNKPVAVGTQEASLVGGDRTSPTNLTFSKSADGMSLVSSAKLPEGNNIPVIITVKTAADAPAVRASFSVDLSHCKGCDLKEYACTCDHGHEH